MPRAVSVVLGRVGRHLRIACGFANLSRMTRERVISLTVLLALLLLLGAMFYRFLAPFLLPLFLAAVLAIICQPVHGWVLARCGGHKALAAGVTTGLVVTVISVPVMIGTVIAAVQLLEFSQTYLSERSLEGSEVWKLAAPIWRWLAAWDPELTEATLRKDIAHSAQQVARQMAGTTLSWVSSSVGAFVSLTVAVGMLLIAFYYFLADGPEFLQSTQRLIPVAADHQQQLWAEFTKATRAVVLATFCAAFAQGLATAVALQVLGFGHFLVFFAAASIASLVPIAGTWMVWGPCALWLLLQGHWMSAGALFLWGVLVVGLLDNIVRTYVLNSDAELHPLLAFVSVLGALQVLGLWGIFIGPIVACCLSGLLKILRHEFNLLLAERSPDAVPAVSGSASALLEPASLPAASPVPTPPDGVA